ncbi:MAG: AraC family transcriptional regulator [Crocinitomicaceae bacterium]|nr:helix-turn-helix domain-containing protein [Flavobacteriales bacterium]NQZ37273.1 AraC family transcriptional regulator [Crocinitomicaceae bacterium]
MTIYIKNMVCNRCKMVVKSIFEKLGLHPLQVELGEVELHENDISSLKDLLIQELQSVGFELLDDKRKQTIEKVKNLITDLVQNQNNNLDITLSEYLTTKIFQDYNSLSNLFSEVVGITIEKYYILQKIERVKELLVYNELTLSEISFQLNYSSVAYLSNQFKKVTGLTPSHFKKFRTVERKPLEEL